jgi:hypothetical protein
MKGIVRTTLSAVYSINKPVTGVSAADYNIEIRWGNQSISYLTRKLENCENCTKNSIRRGPNLSFPVKN